jgi:hypothetical protein
MKLLSQPESVFQTLDSLKPYSVKKVDYFITVIEDFWKHVPAPFRIDGSLDINLQEAEFGYPEFQNIQLPVCLSKEEKHGIYFLWCLHLRFHKVH